MYDKLMEVANNLDNSQNSFLSVAEMPFVLEVAGMTATDVGKLFLRMSREGIDFSSVKDIKGSDMDYALKVRESKDKSERLYYTLKFLKSFHAITASSIDKVLKVGS